MEIFIPGRLCLFGEHTDWAGTYRRFNSDIGIGKAIVVGTNQGLRARISPNRDRFLFSAGGQANAPRTLDLPIEAGILLKEARRGGFFSYVAGVGYQAVTHHHVGGIEIDNYEIDLPVGKGLSSSAAACVLTARAFNAVYGLKLTTRGEMELAYRGETTTPSRCGRLDQACAFGKTPVLLSFDGDSLEADPIAAGTDFHYVVVDLNAGKDTIRILADLNRGFPFPSNQRERAVMDYLGKNSRIATLAAVDAIRAGDAEALGALMTESQEAFDRYCRPASPKELASPVLHGLLADKRIKERVLGGKGVGSHGDGSAQFLVADEEVQADLIKLLEEGFGMTALPLDIGKS